MELRHLRYFIAVAEEENVSRAAQRLYISQPGLSRQIRDLEDELGFPLLERTAKSVRLTEAGRFFLNEAKAVVQHAQDAVKRTQAIALGEGGELHVGYAPSLTVQILPRALRTFQEEFPRLRVALHDLSTGEMLEQLRSGKLAVALVVQTGKALMRGLEFEELARYPMCAAVGRGHAFAKLRSLPLGELANQPLIAYSRAEYPEYTEQLEAIFEGLKTPPRIAEEHDGVTSLTAAVEACRGVALVPSCLSAMTGNRLKLIPVKPAIAPVIVGAAWKKDALSPAAAKFVVACRAPEKR